MWGQEKGATTCGCVPLPHCHKFFPPSFITNCGDKQKDLSLACSLAINDETPKFSVSHVLQKNVLLLLSNRFYCSPGKKKTNENVALVHTVIMCTRTHKHTHSHARTHTRTHVRTHEGPGETFTIVRHEQGEPGSNPGWNCISQNGNTSREGMNQIIFHPAMGK